MLSPEGRSRAPTPRDLPGSSAEPSPAVAVTSTTVHVDEHHSSPSTDSGQGSEAPALPPQQPLCDGERWCEQQPLRLG